MTGLRRRFAPLALGLALLVLAGCAVQTQALRAHPPAQLATARELSATPFFPQTEFHCGPAALATALAAIDRGVPPETLATQVFLPAREGTLQVEMLAGARRQGAVPTRLPAQLEALFAEVQAGHAPVVLLNLGLSFVPRWHYAVLVGYDLDAGDVVLRSGTTERAVMAMRTFEHTWQRAGGWAFVALPPGHWPGSAAEAAVVEAAVGFERVAPPAQAVATYRSALQRFEGNLSLAIGLGNSLYAMGDRAAAAAAFEAAARRHHSAPAWINLATVRLELGERDAAVVAAREAVGLADPAWADEAKRALAQAEAGRTPADNR